MNGIYWGMLLHEWQVTVVAVFGLAATWIALRWRPSAAPALATATIVVIVGVSLTLPIPVPRWFGEGLRTVAADTAASATTGSLAAPSANPSAGHSLAWLTIEPSRVWTRLDRWLERPVRRQTHSALPVVAVTLSVLGLVGLLRLWMAHRFAHRIRRQSRPVSHAEATQIALRLAQRMVPGRRLTIRETEQLSSAAVVGLLQPCVLLPADWREWSRGELQSVLAHELAHIAHRDCLWRAVSSLVTAIHYYNPVLHLVARRFALAQEMTADALAATIVGRDTYVRSLSRLALRRDDKDVSFPQAGLHPVFSGYLIRRITMLRTRREWRGSRGASLAKWAGVACIASVGALSFVAKGVGQPPEKKSAPPAARVARLNADVTQRAGDPLAGMFQRHRIDPVMIPENDLGMIKIALGDLLRQPGVGEHVPLLNQLAGTGFLTAFQSPSAPTIQLESLDALYGKAQLSTRYNADAPGPHKNTLMFGCGDAYVTFRRPVDADRWLTQYVPSVKRTTDNGRNYYILPVIPAMGPAPIGLTMVDARTAAFNLFFVRPTPETDDAERIVALKRVASHKAAENKSVWANAFRRADGGLLTIAFSSKEIRTRPEFEWSGNPDDQLEREAARLMHRIEHTFETLAFGFDINETADTVGVQIRLGSSKRADVDKMAADLRSFRQLGAKLIARVDDKEIEEATAEDKEWLELHKQLLERCEIRRSDYPNGESDVTLRAALAYDVFQRMFVAAIVDDWTSSTDDAEN